MSARIERQQILYDEGRTFRFLVAERVLEWPLGGPSVAGAQRDRLASLARLPSVEVAVLPAGATVAAPWHNFIIWESAGVPASFVTMELVHGAQEVHDPERVQLYDELWERLWSASLTGDEALELIRALT